MFAPTTKKSQKRFCNNPKPPKQCADLTKLNDPQVRDVFISNLDAKLQMNKDETANTSTRSKNLINSLPSAAAETLPQKEKRFETKEDFKDKCFNILLEERSNLTKSTQEYKKTTKKIKKRLKLLRNERLRREAETIN